MAITRILFIIVGISCVTAQRGLPAPTIESVRFQGAPSRDIKEGTLEVRAAGSLSWQLLCPETFGAKEAAVACRQLGFPYLCDVTLERVLNTSADHVLPGSITCAGTEDSLEQCTWDDQARLPRSCSVYFSAFVARTITCATADDIQVRLSAGNRGAVEFRCSSTPWFNICSNDWDARDENTVCNQLGFGGANVESGGPPLPGTAPLASRGIYCSGHEDHLFACIWEELQECSTRAAAMADCHARVTVRGENAPLCDPTLTCRGSCGNSTRAGCRCDDNCRFFDDCCYDYDQECVVLADNLSPQMGTGPDLSYYSCAKSPFISKSYYFIKRCPPSTNDALLLVACQGTSGLEDIIGNLPVYDAGGAVYYNIFCALCHGVDTNLIVPWGVEKSNSSGRPDFRVLPPLEEIGRARPCYLNGTIISTCHPSFQNTSLETACHNYLGVINSDDKGFFRNAHCLRCSERSAVALPFAFEYCLATLSICRIECSEGGYGYCGVVCSPINDVLYLPVLFNFMSTDGERTGVECTGVGEVYDIFLGRCRVLVCPSGTIFTNNTCVQDDSSGQSISDRLGDELSCLASSLASSSMEIREIILEYNATSEEVVAHVITERTNQSRSVDLTLRAIFQPSTTLNSTVCNITQVVLLTSASYTVGLNGTCNDAMTVLDPSGPVVTWKSSSDWNMTYLVYSRYLYSSEFMIYELNELSTNCWFALFNTLSCELNVVAEENIEFDVENNARYLPTGIVVPSDSYIILRDNSVGICAGSLTESIDPLRVIHTIGSCLSLLCLLALVITYAVFSTLRNAVGKCLLNVCIALFVASFIFLLNPVLGLNPVVCSVSAAIAHLFWLGCFCWTTVIGVDMARTFGGRLSAVRKADSCSPGLMISYTLYGWGVPLVVVAICAGIHICKCSVLNFHYGRELFCWITDSRALLYTFGLPVGISVLINIILLIFTTTSVIKKRKSGQSLRASRTSDVTDNILIVIKLVVVLGVPWTLGFIYAFWSNVVVMYIFVMAVSLQGVFLFLLFGFTKRIRNLWREKYEKLRSSFADTTASTKSSSDTHKVHRSSDAVNKETAFTKL